MTLDKAIARLAPKLKELEPGHVWLAGAGPGSAGALTLDVVSALSQADAIVYDALVDSAVLNVADGAEMHFMGKRGGKESVRQDEITALLIALARRGKRVLRLKGGDPYVFGRGGEEALALAHAGIPFHILPGVTSAFGAMASVGIPATMRGMNRAIILATGHAADGTAQDLDWAALAKTGQPIVVYMGLRNLVPIAASLVAGGLKPTTPVAVVMAATTPDERVVVSDLANIGGETAKAGIVSPALIIVGEIVSMRAELIELARSMRSA